MEMRFPDRQRLPLDFAPDRLATELGPIAASGSTEHFVKQNYDGEWNMIALRAPAGVTHPIQTIYSDPSCTEFAGTSLAGGSALLPPDVGGLPARCRRRG